MTLRELLDDKRVSLDELLDTQVGKWTPRQRFSISAQLTSDNAGDTGTVEITISFRA